MMKILYITNMYPTAQHPVYGIFVKEQVDDISAALQTQQEVYFINGREGGKWAYLKSIFLIPLKIARGRYDVIHIHYGLAALFLLFYKPRNTKVFLTLHGADILPEQGKTWQVYVTQKALLKADKVYILNQQMEHLVRSAGANYEILPCGVNTEFFTQHSSLKSVKTSKLIVFPGNPEVEVKNFPLFQAVIQDLVHDSDYEIRVKALRGLSRVEVKELLNAADCLLMTSLSEGSPQIVKEALSCGLPVVSVPVGDVSQMLNAVPDCYVATTFNRTELRELVQRSLNGTHQGIRSAFLRKKIYDNKFIAAHLIKNYRS